MTQQRFNDARLIYEQLVESPLATPALFAEACQPLIHSGALANWEAIAHKATQRFPDHPTGWLLLGQARQKLGHPKLSSEAYQHALKLDPRSAEAWAGIAQVHERLHRLDDALDAINEAIALRPQAYFLRHCRGTILRRMGRPQEAIQQQQSVLDEAPATDPACRYAARMEIAAIERSQGHHDAAKRAVADAKDEQAPLRAPLINAFPDFRQAIEKRYEGLTPETARAWYEADPAAPPQLDAGQVFLVGHPRSGTTLTEQVLAAHPGAVTLDEREMFLHVEAGIAGTNPTPRTLDVLSTSQRQRFCRVYREQVETYLREPIGGRVVVDKRPDSLLLLPSALRFMPASKAVVVLRDPRDVCTSCYEQAFPLSIVSAQFHTIESTCRYYAWFMGQWLGLRDHLPAEMWHEVKYEDLVTRFEPTARALIQFVGLDWDEKVMAFGEQASKRIVSTPSYEAVTRPVNTRAVGRWRVYADEFLANQDILRPYLDAFGYES